MDFFLLNATEQEAAYLSGLAVTSSTHLPPLHTTLEPTTAASCQAVLEETGQGVRFGDAADSYLAYDVTSIDGLATALEST